MTLNTYSFYLNEINNKKNLNDIDLIMLEHITKHIQEQINFTEHSLNKIKNNKNNKYIEYNDKLNTLLSLKKSIPKFNCLSFSKMAVLVRHLLVFNPNKFKEADLFLLNCLLDTFIYLIAFFRSKISYNEQECKRRRYHQIENPSAKHIPHRKVFLNTYHSLINILKIVSTLYSYRGNRKKISGLIINKDRILFNEQMDLIELHFKDINNDITSCWQK
jgi:hypothetical protein